MSQRTLKETNTRKLTRLGNSLVVSLPREILNLLGWKEKQKVVVKKIRGGNELKSGLELNPGGDDGSHDQPVQPAPMNAPTGQN